MLVWRKNEKIIGDGGYCVYPYVPRALQALRQRSGKYVTHKE